ncbi:hypothetical protein A3Q56_07822 [Intoshia linei]|uniref:Uncharacterized protein n=1 Tax=Intoshia linei TaxID=1819745 RepID=A0A177AR37_9BILA|nr:hypothetical protein A3Q56_07822 [Intoshia linei]
MSEYLDDFPNYFDGFANIQRNNNPVRFDGDSPPRATRAQHE